MTREFLPRAGSSYSGQVDYFSDLHVVSRPYPAGDWRWAIYRLRRFSSFPLIRRVVTPVAARTVKGDPMRIRNIFKLWIIAAVVAIAVAASLAACSSEEEAAPQPTAKPAVQPTATTAPQPTATTAPQPTSAAATQTSPDTAGPRDVPRNRTFIGGKIGESLAGDPQNLNPYYSQLMNAGLHFLYESLYYLNIFDGELKPWMADGQPEWNDDFSSVNGHAQGRHQVERR